MKENREKHLLQNIVIFLFILRLSFHLICFSCQTWQQDSTARSAVIASSFLIALTPTEASSLVSSEVNSQDLGWGEGRFIVMVEKNRMILENHKKVQTYSGRSWLSPHLLQTPSLRASRYAENVTASKQGKEAWSQLTTSGSWISYTKETGGQEGRVLGSQIKNCKAGCLFCLSKDLLFQD